MGAIQPMVVVTISAFFFKGLNYQTSPDYIRSLCSRFGQVENVFMKVDHATGRSNGMATVVFRTSDEANQAVRMCPRDIEGRQVHIQLSVPTHSASSSYDQQRSHQNAPHLYQQQQSPSMYNPMAAPISYPYGMGVGMNMTPHQQQQVQQQQQQQLIAQQLQQQQQQHMMNFGTHPPR